MTKKEILDKIEQLAKEQIEVAKSKMEETCFFSTWEFWDGQKLAYERVLMRLKWLKELE